MGLRKTESIYTHTHTHTHTHCLKHSDRFCNSIKRMLHFRSLVYLKALLGEVEDLIKKTQPLLSGRIITTWVYYALKSG